jgi:bifunctional enzyme CysN/CysC
MAGDLLRFTTAGSVDDGKSTLIGRLLLDCRAILEDQMAAIERASRSRGDPYLDLALLTDGLRAEREQGITIDVAYRYFATPRRKFIIADTPGHIQYTRNMVTGASTADLAIILIDARHGVMTQSRRHGFIASLLGIPHVVVAINKMDLVDYRQAVFEAIAAEYRAFASKLAVPDLTFIPVSALHGDNVVEKHRNMPWYDGPTLLHHLEHVHIGAGRNLVDFRFPIQMAVRGHPDFRGYAGQIASGTITPGEEVIVLPSGQTSRVREIATYGGALAEAAAGDSVILRLTDELDISRGDMIARLHNYPQVADRLECTLCWMSEEPLRLGATYIVQHTTRQARGQITGLNYRIDVDTLHREPAGTLRLNEIGRVALTLNQPLCCDPYALNRATGSLILVDPATNGTVAAGMIRRTAQNGSVAIQPPRQSAERSHRSPHSSNVAWAGTAITRDRREARNGHPAAVLWFTGLSGAGKSTIAQLLERQLFALGIQTFPLDGDNVRHGLNGDLGFSAADRQENIRRVAEVAKLAFEQGAVVLCTFISPFRRDRDFARSLIPEGRFIEIHVQCDVATCEARDPKGLYARARRGEIAEFTGISAPYEAPPSAELTVETAAQTPEQCVDAILAALRARGVLRETPA